MAITTPNTHVQLNVHSPKKDAVIGVGSATMGVDDVAIHAGASVEMEKIQSIVGTLDVCRRAILNNLPAMHTNAFTSVGGGSGSVQFDLIAGVTDVSVIVGANVMAKQQSHFINRTFDRLIEVWLEGQA